MKTLSTSDPQFRRSLWVVGGMIALLAAFRVGADVPNFSPLLAVAFCGGLFLSGAWAWVVPLGALLVSDVGLAMTRGYPLTGWWQVAVWGGFVLAIAVGRLVGRRGSLSVAGYFGALVGAGVIFYLVTNVVSWLVMPEYAKSASGLVQALWTGRPGYPPTWTFFRNSLASDLLFGGLILAVRVLAVRPTRAVSAA